MSDDIHKRHDDLQTGITAVIDGALARLPRNEHRLFIETLVFILNDGITSGEYGTEYPSDKPLAGDRQ